jgi:hypothetical protein
MASVYREKLRSGNEVTFVRISALGHCIRGLCAELAGFDPRPFEDGAVTRMEEGNLHEPDILRRVCTEHELTLLEPSEATRLYTARGSIAYVDEEQLCVEVEALPELVWLRGHVDGTTRDRVVEAKAVGRDRYKVWLEHEWEDPQFASYAWQLSGYMYALNVGALFAVKNRDTGQIDTRFIDSPLIPWSRIQEKMLAVVAGGRRDALPDCDRTPEWNCSFRFLHTAEAPEPVAAAAIEEPATLQELEKLGRKWKRLTRLEELAVKRRKAIAERVRAMIGEKATQRTDSFTVSTFKKRNTSYDMDELRVDAAKLGLDVDDYKHETFSKQVQFRKRQKEGENDTAVA